MKAGLWRWRSPSPESTRAIGERVGELTQSGTTILLQGELGAGKTHLAQGIARGLGVPPTEPVTSPSYTLLNTYSARVPFSHFDLYRLGDIDELDELGFVDYLRGPGVVLIEWIDRFPELKPPGLWIRLEYSIAESDRWLEFRATDARARVILDALCATFDVEEYDENL